MKPETAQQPPAGSARQAANGSLKLVLFYAALAGLWILLSDLAVEWLFGSPDYRASAQTLKGLIFVAVTSLLLYVLIRRLTGHIRDTTRREAAAQTEKLRALQLLEAIADSSSDAIFAKDVDDRFVVFNRASERLTGKRPEEVMGRDEMAIFPPELARRLIADNRRVMAEDRVITFQEDLVTAQGDRTYLTTKGPMRDAGGKVIGMFGTARDITERRQAESSLARERGFLKTLIQTLPDLVWLKDTEGVYLACSTRFERFLGAGEADILGKTDYDFFDKELADFFRGKDRAAIAAGKPTINEEEVTYADDGHRELLETIKTPMFNTDGNLIGVLGIARDITAARQAQETLRQQGELLNEMSAIAQIGAWSFDPATGRGTWTEEVARIHEVPPEQETNLAFGLDFYHDEWRRQIETAVREAVELGKPYDLALKLVTAAGTEKWVRTIGRPVSRDGQVVEVRGTFQDITKRKQAEQKILAQLDELLRWQRLTIGREERMLQLKAEVNELLARLGQPARYPSQGD
jgi:PAS domain S-box-containing protein